MRRSRRKVPAKRLFSIKENPEKGRCIHTELLIEKGDEFLEFDGQLTANEPKGNDTYIFEFSHKGKKFWYDATIEDGSYGRLINDNDAHPNCKVKVLEGVGGKPRLIFYALNNIRPGEEVTYDYGQGPYVWRQKKKKKGRGKDKRTVSSASAKEQPVMNGPVPTVTTLQPKADLLGKEPVQPTPVHDSPVKQPKTIHTELTSQNGPEKDKRTVSSASAKEQPVMNGPVPTVTTLQPTADLLGKEPVQPTPVQDSPVKQPKTIHTELTSQNGPEKDKRTVSSASAKEQPVMNGPVPTVTNLQPKADLLGKEPVQPTPVHDSPVKQPKTIHTELTSQNGPEKDKRTVSSASAKEQPVMNGPVPTVTNLQPTADLLGKEPVQPTPVQDSPVKQPKTIHTELTSQNDLDSNRSGLDNDSDDDADYHPSKESDSEDLDSNRSGLDNDSDDDADYHPSKESDREESEDSDPFDLDLDLDKWVSNSEPEESSDFNDMDCLEGSSLLTATAIKEIDGTATLDSDISHQTPMAVSSSETESSTAFSEVLRISNLPRNPEADLDEDTNEETSQKENSKWKPKPDRYCTFCKQVITGGKLKRHMKRKHKLDVAHITAQSKSLQNDYFEKLRKDGIHMYNKILMANKADPKMRERMPKTEDCLRVCDECKGYFSNKYFSKHKCSVKKPTPLKPTLLASADMKEIKNDPEFLDILNRFHDGKMGDLCRSNETIIMIGYRHFNLRRHENGKENEVRKVVMTEMRTLARLYSEFKEICNDTSIEDMLSRSHLEDLCTAIRSLTKTADNSEKHGLKLHVDAVVLRSIKTLKGHFSETMQDEKKTELKHFKDAYTHKSKVLYPKARQTSIRNSFEKARRPQNLPDEMELKKLKHFIEYEIKKSTQNFETSSYAYLRTLVVSRLTLFNARRGEEASRMLLTEWEDGMKSVWLPEEQVEDIEDEAVKFLIGRFKLCYLQGKGKKFVPVLVPNDLVSAINMLVKKRQEFGIAEENKHVFATKDRAGNKSSHCSGWHALNEVCKKVCVTISVTATKMRHRLSTIYASLDMSASDQKIFFDHMGHEKEINKENYQCPQGIRTVQVMGKMLNNIDEGANASAIRTKSHFAGGTDETKSSVKSAEIYPQEDESVKWSRKDTECLRKHFEELIFSADAKNKGRLPSKEEIICYLDHHEPESLKHLDLQDQYIKTRTKLFNERKTARLVIATKLKSITCSK